MSVIYITLPITLLIVFGFLGVFLWSIVKNQWDDLVTPAHRILISEDEKEIVND